MLNSSLFHNLGNYTNTEMYKKLSLKKWHVNDRPCEKMLDKCVSSLSEAKLVVILIGSGNQEGSAVEESPHSMASENNNLNKLGRRTIADFQTLDFSKDKKQNHHPKPKKREDACARC